MRLIAGLGNPGVEYASTRHNAGFMLVDRLARNQNAGWRKEKKFFAELAECRLGSERVMLCKPQTFMNASGEAVSRVAAFYKIDSAFALVIVDDADLPLGTLRLRGEGSPGGHHGLESVEQSLGTRAYPRLKLGIARPQKAARDIAGHVLGRFQDDEWTLWERVLDRAEAQVECWCTDGLSKAMSLYNGRVE
jgi:peptidyl-tRNA hydrolase, PTH1 family